MNQQLSAVFATLFATLCSVGCSDDQPKKSLHGQRNLACLHAQRESADGYEAAIEILEGIVKSDQVVFEDWLNLARARVLHPKQIADADQAIEKARAAGSDALGLAALDYVEGLLQKAKENPGSAHDLFRRVLEVRLDHPEALYQCGYAAELAGRFDDAKKRYERLIEIGRLVRPAAYRLSKAAAKSKDAATEKRALAIFQSRDKNEKPETTKCDLTDLDLRRFARRDVEPPTAKLTFRVIETVTTTDPIHQVLPCPGKTPGTVDLFLLGSTSMTRRGGTTAIPLKGVACAIVIDLDNKGEHEIVIADDTGFRAFARGADGELRRAGVDFPQGTGKAPAAMAVFDNDHDGDLDIVVVTGGTDHQLRVLRNKGDGGFDWQDPFGGVVRLSGPARIDAHDLDQANDLDLVYPGGLALNLRGDKYRPIAVAGMEGRELFAVEDFDNDGAPDIFAAGGVAGWSLIRNADAKGRAYDPRFLAPVSAGTTTVRDLVPADVDNDGDLDILLATESGLTLLRNSGGEFTAEATDPTPSGCRRVEVADLDADGRLEILVIGDDNQLRTLGVAGSNFASIVVAPTGRKDNRSAIGTVTEIYADRFFQSRMIKGPFGVRFGMGGGGIDKIDGLRMRWPQGIRQSTPSSVLRKLPGWQTRRLVFRQIEGLVASCPFLYVRGDDGWHFLTDVIGIAPLAEWMPAGSSPNLDPEEFIRIPGDLLSVRDGRVQLTITEELKETTYLDRVELLYADQPATLEVLIDENLAQGAYDELAVQTFVRGAIAPLAAARVHGVDATSTLAKADGDYAHPYGEVPSQWGGWSEPHTIELTTSAPAELLIFQGRLAWYDSTVSYALAQNGRSWQPMRIEHVLENGETRVLVADAGGPTGMDRTIVVQLGDDVLPAGTKLQVTAQYRFLWDCIRTAMRPTRPQPDVHVARLRRATLYHHGYSEYIGNPATHEQRYDFDRAAPDDRYPRARGFANEYGEVLDLVERHDDRLVIIVVGDAVKLEFTAKPPARGMSRTWFLRVSGWAKESGFHNVTGESIAPLPFRGMKQYPPAAGARTPWRDADATLTRRVR